MGDTDTATRTPQAGEATTSTSGLSGPEAARQLALHGPNEMRPSGRRSLLAALLAPFANPLVAILLLAAAVSGFLGNLVDAAIIAAMMLLSATLNFVLGYRSQRAAERLREEIAPTAAVLRDGRWRELPRRELVPGDIIRLAAGDRIPADARLLSARDLHVQQAALTGESMPVEKEATAEAAEASGIHARHLLFLGTSVIAGTATALVVATGHDTAFGHVAERLAERPPPTEFERGLDDFARLIMRTVVFLLLAVAWRNVPPRDRYVAADETDLVLAGFVAFADPLVPGVADCLRTLARDGVAVKILTGDNEQVARHVCAQVGIDVGRVILGTELAGLNDTALGLLAERGSVFARVTPDQKHRIVLALKARGAVVGFLGDGINDAPSLHAADVGISVANAVDVAREAADIVLRERDLQALHAGVIEGRRAFANVTKYLLMGTSSNFGNMFSMAAGMLFLPYLPMLPTQILLNNFLYDVAQTTIPTDNVDAAQLRRPRRWDIRLIRRFMVGVGPISSLYDFLTFYVLLHGLHASQAAFHTGWFVESLATQTLVLFVIRTAGNPLRSRPSLPLAASVLAAVAAGLLLPWTPLAGRLGFTPLPPAFFVFLGAATATYLLLVEAAKRHFMRDAAAAPRAPLAPAGKVS